jgi:septal ring factor EnvC (AmiA/AmiB activator)
MLNKIALIAVILACLGSLYFANRLQGIKKDQQTQIAQLTSNLNATNAKLTQTQKTLQETSTTLTNVQSELATANANLQAKTVELTAKNQEIEDQKKKIEDANKQTETAKAEAKDAADKYQGLVTKIEATGIKPADQIDTAIKDIRLQLSIASDESKVFGQQIIVLHDENDQLKAKIVELSTTPPGLRAQIVSVNPDWGFVVLNVGKEKHVQLGTTFVIYREDKMIAKGVVRSVVQDACVVDLLPDLTQTAPRVGDYAMH